MIKIFKNYIKIDKNITNFGDTEIEKHKFRQHNSPVLINNIHTHKTVVSDKVSFGKKDFKYLSGYKDIKQDLYVYCFQK